MRKVWNIAPSLGYLETEPTLINNVKDVFAFTGLVLVFFLIGLLVLQSKKILIICQNFELFFSFRKLQESFGNTRFEALKNVSNICNTSRKKITYINFLFDW